MCISHGLPLKVKRGPQPGAVTAAPCLSPFPIPNGPDIGGGLAEHRFAQDEMTNESFFQRCLDHVFSTRDLIFGRYTIDDSTAVKPAPTPNTVPVVDDLNRSQYFTIEYARIASSRILNTARFAFNRTNLHRENRLLGPVDPALSFAPGRPPGVLNIGGIGEWGPSRNNPSIHVRNMFSFSNDLTYSRGPHLLKSGSTMHRFQDARTSAGNWTGTYTFPSVKEFLQGKPAPSSGD